MSPDHRLYVNAESTVLVRVYDSGPLAGKVEVATRKAPDHIWGPPVYLEEER